MPPVGFEPTISAGERPKTYALDRAASGTGELMPVEITNKRRTYFHTISNKKTRGWRTCEFGVATVFRKHVQ